MWISALLNAQATQAWDDIGAKERSWRKKKKSLYGDIYNIV